MLPPNSIKKLSDRFGDYEILVRCTHCDHTRTITPHALARIFEWEAEIERIKQRFRCSKCEKRHVELTFHWSRRPRGIPKNPH
jgi:hypothetical protein